jgi:putative ABC transport system ATP-binding protein
MPGADGNAARATALTKVYGSGDTAVTALRGIDAEFPKGMFTAIMGPSGSGKSTLMHCLAGLDTITSGRVYIGDVDLSALKDKELTQLRRDRVGFVFQQFNLLARTSALENVELPLLYSDDDKSKFKERAMAALTAVGLAERHDHHPSQLSGGQQQRVAIARSLINNPQLILADEPTGALDSRTSIEIMGIFQKLNREKGMSIVVVTHEPDIAHYSNRMLQFKDGHLIVDEAIPNPRNAEQELAEMPELEEEKEPVA